ncbi:helix-turn-helix transcriptional regulator [Entomomonas asaccharolytica]|uniref:AlpA family phage regulatory protein n=1 Tax=Entomomonas asaccharolytica TaxID=2785331 RepID=A0A974RX22_9GAMM|nr:AlpA family phage regulatory protein [Entomomonas asaccharolytica]QQP85747.1 AlpA family phage regulatory protein [Entomomonas asaccharolytica]
MQTESKRLIRLHEVMNLTGLSRASVYNYIKSGIFPPPAKFGKSSLWEYTEIQEWISNRLQERDNK